MTSHEQQDSYEHQEDHENPPREQINGENQRLSYRFRPDSQFHRRIMHLSQPERRCDINSHIHKLHCVHEKTVPLDNVR